MGGCLSVLVLTSCEGAGYESVRVCSLCSHTLARQSHKPTARPRLQRARQRAHAVITQHPLKQRPRHVSLRVALEQITRHITVLVTAAAFHEHASGTLPMRVRCGCDGSCRRLTSAWKRGKALRSPSDLAILRRRKSSKHTEQVYACVSSESVVDAASDSSSMTSPPSSETGERSRWRLGLTLWKRRACARPPRASCHVRYATATPCTPSPPGRWRGEERAAASAAADRRIRHLSGGRSASSSGGLNVRVQLAAPQPGSE